MHWLIAWVKKIRKQIAHALGIRSTKEKFFDYLATDQGRALEVLQATSLRKIRKINEVCGVGDSPFYALNVAATKGHLGLVEYLYNALSDTQKHEALRNRNYSIVKKSITLGKNIEVIQFLFGNIPSEERYHALNEGDFLILSPFAGLDAVKFFYYQLPFKDQLEALSKRQYQIVKYALACHDSTKTLQFILGNLPRHHRVQCLKNIVDEGIEIRAENAKIVLAHVIRLNQYLPKKREINTNLLFYNNIDKKNQKILLFGAKGALRKVTPGAVEEFVAQVAEEKDVIIWEAMRVLNVNEMPERRKQRNEAAILSLPLSLHTRSWEERREKPKETMLSPEP